MAAIACGNFSFRAPYLLSRGHIKMKKRLIALRGRSKVGKSSALHILYKLLLAEPEAKTLSFEKFGRLLDFSAVVELRGCKVGIVNRGDVAEDLDEYISDLAAEPCRIIVCAARTKGDVENVLDSYRRRYEVVEVAKIGCDKKYRDASNLTAAHQLAAYVYGALVA